MPIVGVSPETGTPAFVVAPKDTNEEDAVHLALQESLSYGIRAIRASFGLRSKVYRAILDVICYGTRTPAQCDECLAQLATIVQLSVVRDMHQLCMDGPMTTLDAWVRYLHRAQFVQDGYMSVLYPYNAAVSKFNSSQLTTCAMVRAGVEQMLNTCAPLCQWCVRCSTTDYVQACLTYVHTASLAVKTPVTMETLKATPARTALAEWYTALRAYGAADEWLPESQSTLLPVLLEGFQGFTDCKSGMTFLMRVYEVEVAHCQMMTSLESRYMKRRSARRIFRHFELDAEWNKLQERLLSPTPLDGPSSLYYDESMLHAFVHHDKETLCAFGTLIATDTFREIIRASGFVCVHLFYLYAAASLQLHTNLRASTIRELWALLGDPLFSGEGPGGAFGKVSCDSWDKMQELEWLFLSRAVLALLRNGQSDCVDAHPHVLLPWLMEMMDPHTLDMTWTKDRKWWLDLWNACTDREDLLNEYLDESLMPRIVMREVVTDDEMDLMVSLSLCFKDNPSRALQRFRLLLTPCSLSPEYSDTDIASVYLAPRVVWDNTPSNLYTDASLHPVVRTHLTETADAYPNDYFAERRVTWSHWYSSATVELERPGMDAYSLTAPVFAVSLVAYIADAPEGRSQHDLVKLGCPVTRDSPIEQLYMIFWLRYLVEHHVLGTVITSAVPSKWVYSLRMWEGTRTVPVPDVPRWWSGSRYRMPEGCGCHAEHRAEVRATERLLVAKELVESKCVYKLKQSHVPMTQSDLHTYLHQEVKAFVTVSNQHMSEMVDALVRKGYIARDKEGRLAFATAEDVDVD